MNGKDLKGVYEAWFKVDIENFYLDIADEAESGFKLNSVGPAYRERLRGNAHGTANGHVVRSGGHVYHTRGSNRTVEGTLPNKPLTIIQQRHLAVLLSLSLKAWLTG